jgi:hypothetical protein
MGNRQAAGTIRKCLSFIIYHSSFIISPGPGQSWSSLVKPKQPLE